MGINERRVELLSDNTVYGSLKDYMDRIIVRKYPFDEISQVVVAGANFVLLDDSMFGGSTPSNLAIGTGTTTNKGLVAALLAGAVGTGSINTISDSEGNITNKVLLRDADSHDPIIDSVSGREVYGLIQAVSTAVDGDPIGTSGSENIQISFVYVASGGVLTLANITATVEFMRKVATILRRTPTYIEDGGGSGADAIQGATYDMVERKFIVTTAFASAEVINLTTGAGGASGVATVSGDTIASIGVSAAVFNDDANTQFFEGSGKDLKGTEVIWDSTISLHVNRILDVGDTFSVLQMINS